MPRSSVTATATRLTERRVAGAPVYAYVRTPGTPPISVLRFSADRLPVAHATPDHAHAHDFLVLAYFEHGGGSLALGERHWPLRTGDAFVIAPGEVVRVSHHFCFLTLSCPRPKALRRPLSGLERPWS